MPVSNDKLLTLQLWDSAGDEKTMAIGRRCVCLQCVLFDILWWL